MTDPLTDRLRADARRHLRPLDEGLRARLHATLADAPAPQLRRGGRRWAALGVAATLLFALGLALSSRGTDPSPASPRRLVRYVLPDIFGELAGSAYQDQVTSPLLIELGALQSDAQAFSEGMLARFPRSLRRFGFSK